MDVKHAMLGSLHVKPVSQVFIYLEEHVRLATADVQLVMEQGSIAVRPVRLVTSTTEQLDVTYVMLDVQHAQRLDSIVVRLAMLDFSSVELRLAFLAVLLA